MAGEVSGASWAESEVMRPLGVTSSRAEVPEGWFPDPWHLGSLRWWDGGEWTGHTTGSHPIDVHHGHGMDALADDRVDASTRKSAARTDQRIRAWFVIVCGGFVLLIGLALGLSSATSVHGVAIVLKQGPCAVSGDAGLVCDERVQYRDGDRTVVALMHGVNPDEVRGPPMHRTLAILYSHGDTGPPSTDDMPLWVPVGLSAVGALLLLWGLMMRAGKWRARNSSES
jgi:hypothetical protein